ERTLGSSEYLAQHQGRSVIGSPVRLPTHCDVDVDLELVGQEQVQRRPARAGGLDGPDVGRAIDRAEQDLIVENAELAGVAQQGVAELEPHAGELAGEVRTAEGTVQVTADGLLVGKEHP